jgi:hypothetical protein
MRPAQGLQRASVVVPCASRLGKSVLGIVVFVCLLALLIVLTAIHAFLECSVLLAERRCLLGNEMPAAAAAAAPQALTVAVALRGAGQVLGFNGSSVQSAGFARAIRSCRSVAHYGWQQLE